MHRAGRMWRTRWLPVNQEARKRETDVVKLCRVWGLCLLCASWMRVKLFLVCLVPRTCAWFASRLCLHRATGLVPGSVEMNPSKTHGFSLLSLANQ